MIKALWHLSAEKSQIVEEPLSSIDHQQIAVKSHYSLISSGTEYLVASGQVPSQLHQSMQVPHMGGSFSFPIKYGYSLVGKVSSEGPLKDKMVHLLYPHQNCCTVNTADLFVIPNGIPPKRATLASNVETALTAIWDSQVSIGDRVLVVGFGMIGALVARLLSFLPAIKLGIVEKNPARQQLAKQMGFQIWEPAEHDLPFDLAFHSSASAAGLQTAIDAVGLESKIIELSWYGEKISPLVLGGSFHQQRKQIISSQVSRLPSSYQARWDFKRRKETVFELLKNPTFDQHVTHEVPFDESPMFFEQLRKRDLPDGLGWCIAYPNSE